MGNQSDINPEDESIQSAFLENNVIKIRGDWTKPNKQIEEYLGEGFITSNSLREYYGKLARASLIYSGQDSSISPVLPINLSFL